MAKRRENEKAWCTLTVLRMPGDKRGLREGVLSEVCILKPARQKRWACAHRSNSWWARKRQILSLPQCFHRRSNLHWQLYDYRIHGVGRANCIWLHHTPYSVARSTVYCWVPTVAQNFPNVFVCAPSPHTYAVFYIARDLRSASNFRGRSKQRKIDSSVSRSRTTLQWKLWYIVLCVF